MKGLKITYWTTTVLLSLMMLMAGSMYFLSPEVAEGFHKIGMPDYFRVELGIAKILGAIILPITLALRIKEWVYFGFFLMFASAFNAHLSNGDTNIAQIFVALLLLITSYITFHRLLKLRTAARV